MSLLQLLAELGVRQVSRFLAHLSAGLHRRHAPHYPVTVAPPIQADEMTNWWTSEARWYTGETPPSKRHAVVPLVDGEHFFSALAEAMSNAQDYIYVVGWCFTPHMPLQRSDHASWIESQVVNLLSEAAQRIPVRILLWSGAPAFFEPTVRTVQEMQAIVQKHGKGDLRCRLDYTATAPHCHHQKAIVIDGQIAFVGGMDITTFLGDRWDTQRHPLRLGPNWHDVQLSIRGDGVADVEENFRQRWIAATGDTDLPHRDPVCDPSWHVPIQIVRTIPAGIYAFAPDGHFGTRHAYIEAINAAHHTIYIENQYIWDTAIVQALVDAIRRPRQGAFHIVIVLPARAEDGKLDNDQHVKILRAADGSRTMVSVFSLYSSGPGAGTRPFSYRPTYVHSKVAIFDDEWAIVGSSNLNNRGLARDSELNVLIHDHNFAHELRVSLWAEHLGLSEDEVRATDPGALVANAWQPNARVNKQIMESGLGPLRGAVHEYETGRMPGTWLFEAAEALTFDL